MRTAIFVAIALALSLLPVALAQVQSHPLSEITPVDVNLNLSGKNITNVTLGNFSNLVLSGIPNCDTIDTLANGSLVCGQDTGNASQSENVSWLYGWNGSQWVGLNTTQYGVLRLSVEDTLSSGWITTGATVTNATPNTKVGIGTASPSTTLHVIGNVTIGGTNTGILFPDGSFQQMAETNVSLLYGNDSGTWRGLSVTSTGILRIKTEQAVTPPWAVSGANLYNDTSGTNVSLGTTSGLAKLQVHYDDGRTSLTGTNKGQIHVTGGGDVGDVMGITFRVSSTTSPNNAHAGIFADSTPSGSRLHLGTSNSYADGVTNTALTINHEGGVGIGTVTIATGTKLNVSGSAAITALASCDTIDSTSNGTLQCGTDAVGAGVQGWVSSGGVLYNNTATGIGIGTTSPSSIGSGSISGRVVNINDSGSPRLLLTGGYPTILFERKSHPVDERIFMIDANNAGGVQYLGFSTVTDALSATARMVLTSAGLVGINNTSPASLLDIQGGGSRTLTLQNTDNSGLTSISLENSTGTERAFIFWRNTGASAPNVLHIGSDTNITFRTGASLSNNMHIDSSGNVGIGTTGPITTLHVADTSDAQLLLDTNAADGSAAEIIMRSTAAGNANWVIGTNKAVIGGAQDNLYFYKNAGTTGTKMVITNTGLVGIGTTGPSTKLDVQGANVASRGILYINGTDHGFVVSNAPAAGTTGYALAKDGTVEWTTGMAASTDAYYIAEGSNVGSNVRLAVLAGGNVGINTTNPTTKLDVYGAGNNDNIATFKNSSGAHRFQFFIESDGSSSLYMNDGNGGTANLIKTSGTSYFTGGKVGIGTTNPQNTVEIEGSLTIDEQNGLNFSGRDVEIDSPDGDLIRLYAGVSQREFNFRSIGLVLGETSSGDPRFYHNLTATSASSGSTNVIGSSLYISGGQSTGNARGGNITFLTTPAGSSGTSYNLPVERMIIDHTGKVGINTSSPEGALHIRGKDYTNTNIVLQNPASGGRQYEIAAYDSQNSPGGGVLIFTDTTSGFPTFVMDGLRRVAAVRELAPAAGNSLCYSTTNVSSFNTFSICSSSKRYKEDITPLIVDKEKLFQLEPVKFKWKERNETGVGLIAEDVQQLIPEIVTNYNGQIESVEYKLLTVYLLEIQKEHDKEIQKLHNENSELKTRLEALEAKVNG